MIGNKLGKVFVTMAIASLGLCTAAYGQKDQDCCDIIQPEEESEVGKLWFGVRAGVSASSFGNNTSSFDLMDGTLNSFTGGVFLRYQALEWLAIQPEVSFLQTGANGIRYTVQHSNANFFSGPYPDATTRGEAAAEGRVMLNTVEGALNAIFTPKDFMPKVRPYFVFGTSYGFIINARLREEKMMTFPGSGTTVSTINTIDNTSNYRVFDFGLNYGVGSRFNILGNTGFVELRYRWGISNISNFSQLRLNRPSSLSNKSFAPQDLTNHSLMLTTGIMFGGKSGSEKKEKKKKGEETEGTSEE